MTKETFIEFMIVAFGIVVGFSLARITADFVQKHGVSIATGQLSKVPLP